jgi:hypothetical protein
MVSHPQKKTNHPQEKSGDLKMFHTIFAPPCSTHPSPPAVCVYCQQGHPGRLPLPGPPVPAGPPWRFVQRRLWKPGNGPSFLVFTAKFHMEAMLCNTCSEKTIHAVRNDASRHVNFFLAGVRWPHSMGKNHPLNPFFNCVFGGPS